MWKSVYTLEAVTMGKFSVVFQVRSDSLRMSIRPENVGNCLDWPFNVAEKSTPASARESKRNDCVIGKYVDVFVFNGVDYQKFNGRVKCPEKRS